MIPSIYGEDYEVHWGRLDVTGSVVLDLGADHGSTASFFLSKGAKLVIAVEGDGELFKRLEKNSEGLDIIPVWAWVKDAETIANLLEAWKPDVVKMDIEGSEDSLLDLTSHVRVKRWAVEIHHARTFNQIKRWFEKNGYLTRVEDYLGKIKIIYAQS